MAGSGNVLKKVARLFSTRPVNYVDPTGRIGLLAALVAIGKVAETVIIGAAVAGVLVCTYIIVKEIVYRYEDVFDDIGDALRDAGSVIVDGVTDFVDSIKDSILYAHRKKHKHTRNKHEEGEARAQRDAGGEKGDVRRQPNPNKRRKGSIFEYLS
jgi:ABC-type transport system involved in cytochrome bd biosynthesis fused ATPase/permease subunit